MAILFILIAAFSLLSESPNQQPKSKQQDTAKTKMKPTLTEVLEKYTDRWMDIPGVVGTGEGASDGKPDIVIFVERKTDMIAKKIPDSVEGYKVRIKVTGAFEAR